MIEPCNAPEGPSTATFGINKFMGRGGAFGPEGHRGILIARHKNGKQAVVLATTTSLDPADGIEWGRLYLVREKRPEWNPFVVRGVEAIPNTKDWEMAHMMTARAVVP